MLMASARPSLTRRRLASITSKALWQHTLLSRHLFSSTRQAFLIEQLYDDDDLPSVARSFPSSTNAGYEWTEFQQVVDVRFLGRIY